MNDCEQCAPASREDAAASFDPWLVVVRAMRRLFPYLDIEDVSRFEPLQDELELTTADFVLLMAAVTEQTGVVVPRREYPLVSTLDDLEHYLASRLVSATE